MRLVNPILVFILLSVNMIAAPAMQNSDAANIQKLSGYYVDLITDSTAVILDSYATRERYYTQDTLRIPVVVERTGPSLGGSPVVITYDVVALDTKAFYGASAQWVEFVSPSNVATIGTQAMANMANIAGTLTLPASLDSLALSAIILPNITKIVFLGATPPRCALDKTSKTTYNPWTSSAGVTAANIEIAVPEGAKDAYKAAAGIGDYFTCLKNDTPTALEESSTDESHAKKVVSNGRVVILRNGKVYSIIGVVV